MQRAFIKKLGSEICSIWPLDDVCLRVQPKTAKIGYVQQWEKNFACQLARKIHRAAGAISKIELN